MIILRDLSAFLADRVAESDFFWGIISKTIVRWSQYLCQERRNVEARRVVAVDPLLNSIFKDAKVMGGPFQGMMYGGTSSFCSAYYPKILGTYEMELIPAINAFLDKGYCQIVDVGAADGFYAVGFALKSPESKIIAYEQSPHARKQLAVLARTNGVQGSIEIRERCERNDMMRLPSAPGLLIVDCEGYEEVLLDDSVIQHLKDWDFLIETHDGFSRGVTRRLIERFNASHDVTVVDTVHDLDKADRYLPSCIAHLPRIHQDLLLSEQREHATLRWLVCHSRI
jgi:hypothetical protein